MRYANGPSLARRHLPYSAAYSAARRGRGERGSVFIVALMVLVMLTVIGLSLALVTETEMLIGGNEQVINETFFAAETGLAVAVTQLMAANSLDDKCMAQLARSADDTARMVGVRNLGYSVDYTSLYPVAFHLAPYTRANEGRDEQLFAGFFRGQARAIRGSWLVTEDSDLDSAALTVPREPGQELDDIDFTVQAEKIVNMAFYSTPLQGLEAGTLVDAFDHPENFGCDPHPEHDEITAGP